MNKIKEYCTYCGRRMEEREPITADHFGPGLFYFPYPFDSKTGKKLMRRWIACPKYNHWLFGNGYKHDAHAVGEEYLK